MISTATYSNPRHPSTYPNLWVFYPCPPNMSIAWTYRTPSVHFSREFGQVNRRGRLIRFTDSSSPNHAFEVNLKELCYGG
jgi:hypothetical protein